MEETRRICINCKYHDEYDDGGCTCTILRGLPPEEAYKLSLEERYRYHNPDKSCLNDRSDWAKARTVSDIEKVVSKLVDCPVFEEDK